MKRSGSIGAALLVLLVAAEARAACNVTTTGISFGAYDVFSAVPLTSTGTISVTCDEVPPPNVTIAIGPGVSGFNPRRMRHGTLPDTLSYNLFTTASMNAIWGDGTGGTSTVGLHRVRRNQGPVPATVYGRIPAGQDVSVGSYADTLTVTITW